MPESIICGLLLRLDTNELSSILFVAAYVCDCDSCALHGGADEDPKELLVRLVKLLLQLPLLPLQ